MAVKPRGFWQPDFWLAAWYEGRWWLRLLTPLSGLFSALAARRRRRQTAAAEAIAAPVIVVGNITLGGTGKTPLLIALVKHLQTRGYTPGVISRGYGGHAPHYPYRLTTDSKPESVGDEPLLIFQATACPVVVGPDRAAAAKQLLAQSDCDVILSDDGLQHYRLARALEIAVIDGQRGLGNGCCLPAGPLREPPSRLQEVDLVVVNGDETQSHPALLGVARHSMTLAPSGWYSVQDNKHLPVAQLPCDNGVAAVAGIGNPQRFFNTLAALGVKAQTRAFADHHHYCPEDFAFAGQGALLMTAKDAVKCQAFARPNWWYLGVDAQLPGPFWQALETRLDGLRKIP